MSFYKKVVLLQTQFVGIGLLFDDSVAQQVEHNTFNVGVLGSSPSWVTNQQRRTGTLDSGFFV